MTIDLSPIRKHEPIQYQFFCQTAQFFIYSKSRIIKPSDLYTYHNALCCRLHIKFFRSCYLFRCVKLSRMFLLLLPQTPHCQDIVFRIGLISRSTLMHPVHFVQIHPCSYLLSLFRMPFHAFLYFFECWRPLSFFWRTHILSKLFRAHFSNTDYRRASNKPRGAGLGSFPLNASSPRINASTSASNVRVFQIIYMNIRPCLRNIRKHRRLSASYDDNNRHFKYIPRSSSAALGKSEARSSARNVAV